MDTVICTIPSCDLRYDTAGDWRFLAKDEYLIISVMDMGNWKYEFLIALHEMIEAVLCKHANISTEMVDEFDMKFGANLDDPGLDVRSPYHQQHMVATAVEMMMAHELGVEWVDYNKYVKTGELK